MSQKIQPRHFAAFAIWNFSSEIAEKVRLKSMRAERNISKGFLNLGIKDTIAPKKKDVKS